jgi:hypothetical protein
MIKEIKMPAEKLDIRIGALAVTKGFITPEQLVEALIIQVNENLYQSKHRLIGEILLEKEYITIAQISAVLEAMDIFEA